MQIADPGGLREGVRQRFRKAQENRESQGQYREV
jgi:hypothetical protein